MEAVCAKHVDAIVQALGLESVASTVSGWRIAGKGASVAQTVTLKYLFT